MPAHRTNTTAPEDTPRGRRSFHAVNSRLSGAAAAVSAAAAVVAAAAAVAVAASAAYDENENDDPPVAVVVHSKVSFEFYLGCPFGSAHITDYAEYENVLQYATYFWRNLKFTRRYLKSVRLWCIIKGKQAGAELSS